MIHYKETHSAPHVPARQCWSHVALPFLEVHASGPNAVEPDRSSARFRQAIPGYLASSWRCAGLLESCAGRPRL